MNTVESIAIIAPIVTTAVSGVVGWFAGRRKRNNDALATMQKTIDELVAKNAEYVTEITALRAEVAKWQATANELQQGQATMQAKLTEIQNENARLLDRIESPKPIKKKGVINGTV